MTEPRITSAAKHYGTPTVWVEPYRTETGYGEPVEVDQFFTDGGLTVVTGVKIRRDGTPGVRRVVISNVTIPANVRLALNEIH